MSQKEFVRRSFLGIVFAVLTVPSTFSQGTLKNGGTFRNTGSATYKEVQNYTTTAGTIMNSGTINISQGGGTGNLLNSSGALNGTIRNYIGGTGAGTIVCAGSTGDYSNGTGSTDNDSLNGYVGTIKLIGALSSTGTLDTDNGKVEYNGSGAQSVFLTSYGALVASGGNTKTLTSGTTTVNDSLRIASSTTLNISTFTLSLNGQSNASSGTLTASSGTVDYSGDRDQTIIPGTYGVLTLSGSTSAHTKSVSAGISFGASGSLTVGANDTLDVTAGTLDLNTNSPSLTNNGVIKVGGDLAIHGGITNVGDLMYYGGGAQTIASGTYTDLLLQGAGAKNFGSNTVIVTGAFSIAPGAGARNYGTSTVRSGGTSGTQTISGLSSESFNTLEFGGGAAKDIAAGSLGAVTATILTGSGVVTNNATFSITAGGLNVQPTGSFVNAATVDINGGDITNDGTITNNGSITVQ